MRKISQNRHIFRWKYRRTLWRYTTYSYIIRKTISKTYRRKVKIIMTARYNDNV